VRVASGNFALADDAALLTVTGPVTAANIGIGSPTALSIAGTIASAGLLSLTVGGGGIFESGSILAATLQGASAGAADLGGANAIARIASFGAGGAFTLADATALTLTGTLAAPLIDVTMPGAPFTLADGAAIVTGGTPQPADAVFLNSIGGGGALLAAQVPSSGRPALSGGQPVGAYFSVGGFSQFGSSRIGAFAPGGASILRIDASGGGGIGFADLQGPGTWLIVGVDAGEVTGNVFVRSLTLQYQSGAAGADLSGTVNLVGGSAAAGLATILPTPSAQFRLNDCPIHSVNCVVLPTETLPSASPLQNFTIGTLLDPDSDDDLLLPIVSSEDY
jgi:hypothetical protein